MIVYDLKKSILDSAFKGKLHTNSPKDTDIDSYISLVKSDPRIKRKDLNSTFEQLFEIPNNWKWIQLGDICGIYGGKRIPAGRKLVSIDTGHKYIRVADMNNYTVELDNIMYVPEDIFCSIKKYTINKEDLYITVAGTIGKVGFIPDELDGANLTENANKLVFSNINKEWLYFLMVSPIVQNQINEMVTKVGQPKLAIKRIANILIPLPPIEEQQRIVNKIKELFSILNEIEPIEIKINNLKSNFSGEFRKSIIQSACNGNLSIQSENESVTEMLNTIEKYNGAKIENISDKVPFSIPNNWFWIRFGDLVSFDIGKTPARADSSLWGNDFNWVSISDMIDDGLINGTKEMVSQKAFDNVFKGKISKKGTLIMSFKLTVGRCSLLNVDAFHNEGIISIYPHYDSEVLKKYLMKILPFMTKYGNTKGAIKGNTLNSSSLKELLIPLPPIEEQQRILDKIEELLPLLNDIDNLAREWR